MDESYCWSGEIVFNPNDDLFINKIVPKNVASTFMGQQRLKKSRHLRHGTCFWLDNLYILNVWPDNLTTSIQKNILRIAGGLFIKVE